MQVITTKVLTKGADAFEDSIRRLMIESFPAFPMQTSAEDQLEILTGIFLASGQVRQKGTMPSPEGIVHIRSVIRDAIAAQRPIPVLIPWGSEKPVPLQIVDIAEVMAFKTITCLQDRVIPIYEPGMTVRIRIEDASAPFNFPWRMEAARRDARIYTGSLMNLWNVLLKPARFVELVPESHIVNEETFNEAAENLLPLFKDYLSGNESDISKLAWFGWRGNIGERRREHYRAIFRKQYGMKDDDVEEMVARYFASALARKRLDMLGDHGWNDYIRLTFTKPVPDDPVGGHRLHYRTIPENISTVHLAPWRAKGYLRVKGGEYLPRLAGWDEEREYNEITTLLDRDDAHFAEVRTDVEV